MITRTLEQWRQIIDEQQASELDVKSYCQQNNINTKTFYNRRLKLGRNNAVTTTPAFIKAEPIKLEAPQTLTLTLGEAKLDIPTTASPQWIAGLLKAVAS